MKKIKNLTFILLILLLIAPTLSIAFSIDKKTPFSSPDEKRFLLTLAGRDGQIDVSEWETSLDLRKEKGYFKKISWGQISSADLDGNGSVNVNEFYRYLDRRLRSAQKSNTKKDNANNNNASNIKSQRPFPNLMRASVDDSSSVIDRRMLFQRAKIAKRTKFQNTSNPQKKMMIQRKRQEHLKSIREKRRNETAGVKITKKEDLESLRNMYKCRLVKNRREAVNPRAESSRRSELDMTRRKGVQQEEVNRRRKLFNVNRRRAEEQPSRRNSDSLSKPRGNDSSSSSNRGARSKKPSDIRGLIQPKNTPTKRSRTPSSTKRDKK